MKYRFHSYDEIRNAMPDLFVEAAQQPCHNTYPLRLNELILQEQKDARYGALSPEQARLTEEVFHLLFSSEQMPRRVRELDSDNAVRSELLDRLTQSSAYAALRACCAGQAQAAYEAALAYVQSVAEQQEMLMDKTARQRRALCRLERKSAYTERTLRMGLASPQAAPQEICRTAAKAMSLREQKQAMARQLTDALLLEQQATDKMVQTAAAQAQEKALWMRAVSRCWGDGKGPGGAQALPQELVERVRQNPDLEAITRQLGRMKEILSSMRKNSYAIGHGEKYAVTHGRSLSDLLSGELALLADPATTTLFLKKWNSKALRQYQRRDMVRKGRGDIIVCLDESGSMAGDKACWSKALALAVQDICAHDGRKFALIHFASADEIQTDLFFPNQYTSADLLQAAEHFFDGGTNFEAPLREALRVMDEENFDKADILFITDGKRRIDDALVADMLRAQSERHCSIVGLLIGQDSDSCSLRTICERIYMVDPLTMNALEKEVFRRIST